MKDRKAQEEMVGFVLIVILVVVISLVFLGFSLRQKSKPETNVQVDNLLSAMLSYTTDCALYMPEYEKVGDLIKSCYYSEQCSNGKNSCNELKDIMNKLLNSAKGDLGKDRPIKAYELNASYSAKQDKFAAIQEHAPIIYISNGACTGTSIGTQQFVPLDNGNIIISLKFCY
jgi:hypothetical protein